MCGICGLAAIDGVLDPAVRDALPAMNAAIRHRGPDGDGFFADDYVALGHRRLAIIDRALGAQPLSTEDGACQIVFNGEIYNYRKLRQELVALGHRFHTNSDTETIAHAYEQYGPACVERLEGMFAIAIYDQRRREVFLARDRVGKKPLFYAVLGGVLHFASEIKALAQSPLWDDAIDGETLEGYLSLGYILAPRTIYRHVRKLEPGHWLRLRGGAIEVRKYWDIDQFDGDDRDETALVDEIETLLRDLVRDRLESEVPLGAFLSGGIDSGLVVSFMSEALGRDLVTTSVGFGEQEHNELEAAGLVARHFSSRHHAEVLSPNLDNVLDPIVAAFDEPFADPSAVPTYYVSKIARRHVTVALSGDGGDEVFGGYVSRYVPHAIECFVRPAVSGLSAGPAMRRLGAAWPRSRQIPRAFRLGTIIENLGWDAAAAYYSDLCFVKPFEVRELLGQPPDRDPRSGAVYEAVTAPYRTAASSAPLQRAQYADFKIYLANDVLVKVDRMSMAHGLEVRAPLLDRRIVELAFRIPSSRKTPRLAPKYLLRKLAARRLPSALLRLPKHGFSAPVGTWIRDRYSRRFTADVFGSDARIRSLIDVDVVRGWYEEHCRGTLDRSQPLWTVWMLERWAQSVGSSHLSAVGRSYQADRFQAASP